MPEHFKRTQTILDTILDHKVSEVAARQQRVPLQHLRDAAALVTPPRDMIAALHRDTVALIAEVKHASPSRGVLVEPFDAARLGKSYARHGAAAISVLTDEEFFQGRLEDMTAVRNLVDVPVLRKDFVMDPYQVYEGRAAGADAILLIVAALEDAQLRDLHDLARELGMAALVEVHDERELERALAVSPALVGINNRDLTTFKVDLNTTLRLARWVPDGVTLVAESGIQSRADVRRMGEAGAHAVLVGEALVQSAAIGRTVKGFSSQWRRAAR